MGMEDRDYYWEDRKRREALMLEKVDVDAPHQGNGTGNGKPWGPIVVPRDYACTRRSNLRPVTMKGFLFGAFCGVSATLTTILFNPSLLNKPLTFIGYFWRGLGIL